MMPLLFVLFLGLGVYIFTLPGSENGYHYIFTIDPAGLKDVRLWIYAFGQAFFSLSIAGNGTVIYGSYLSDSEDIPGSARNVAFFDTLAALLAAFVIIPGMAAGGAELSSGGPGLMFIYLLNVFNGMPGGRICGMVFYVCVLFAGMSSLVNLYEAPVETLQERCGLKRPAAVAVIAVIGCGVALFIQGIVSGWMDVVSIYICPLGAMLAGIMFFWVAGKEFALEAVNRGAKREIGAWFVPLGKYVLVPAAFVALVAGALLGGYRLIKKDRKETGIMREKLTKSDVEKIQAEIEHRKLEVRPKCLEAVKEARAHGDLSENFEYHAAKKDKNQNESRIRYLENMLKNAIVISDESRFDEVGLNKAVTLYMEDDDEEETYKLVTSIRGNSMHNMVSIESPLGKAILRHKVGDRVEITTDNGYSYFAEIRKIEDIGDEDDTIRKNSDGGSEFSD